MKFFLEKRLETQSCRSRPSQAAVSWPLGGVGGSWLHPKGLLPWGQCQTGSREN